MRVISPPRLLTLITAAVMLSILLAVPHRTARAASITVTTSDDVIADDGECSLREAIIAANTNTASTDTVGGCAAGDAAATDTITLESFQIYFLDLASSSEDASLDGDLDITDNAGASPDLIITSDGFDYAVIIQDSGDDRVFQIHNAQVEFENLVIIGGSLPAGFGGGINNSGTLTITNSIITENLAASGFGGGISNTGTLTIIDSTLDSNAAVDGFGGGINNAGTLTITGSTFSSNSAGSAFGGDITNSGTLVIANSTFHGGTAAFGGSMYLVGGSTSITNATITGGTGSFGAGINLTGGTLTVANTIVADQVSGSDCSLNLALTSNGNNIESGTSCGFTAGGDLQSVSSAALALGPLQDNGGPSDTRALGALSVALDAGNNTICANAPVGNVDQRGLPRPQDGNGDASTVCDIGAFEFQPPDLIAEKYNDTFFDVAYVDVPFTWIVELVNIGDSSLSFSDGQWMFTDSLPLNVDDILIDYQFFDGATGALDCVITPQVDWNELNCEADGAVVIPAQASIEIYISVIPTETGTLNNPVQQDGAFCWVDPDNAISETIEENNFCNDAVTVQLAPDLVAVKTNDTNGITTPGATFNWTISITNQGEGAAVFDDFGCGCVTIFVDLLPEGATYGTPTIVNTSGLGGPGTLTCDANPVALFCEADDSFTIDPDGGFDIILPVTVTATSGQLINPIPPQGFCAVDPNGITGDIDYSNNECSDAVGINEPPNPPAPTIFDPALSKSGSPASARVGEVVTWTVVVSNPHAVALPGIVVTDTIPDQFTINNVRTEQGTSSTSGQTITVNVGTLAVGQSVTITIVTTAVTSPTNGTICNTAQSGGSFAQTCMQVFPSNLPPTGGASPMAVWLRNGLLALIAVVSIATTSLWVLKRPTV